MTESIRKLHDAAGKLIAARSTLEEAIAEAEAILSEPGIEPYDEAGALARVAAARTHDLLNEEDTATGIKVAIDGEKNERDAARAEQAKRKTAAAKALERTAADLAALDAQLADIRQTLDRQLHEWGAEAYQRVAPDYLDACEATYRKTVELGALYYIHRGAMPTPVTSLAFRGFDGMPVHREPFHKDGMTLKVSADRFRDDVYKRKDAILAEVMG